DDRVDGSEDGLGVADVAAQRDGDCVVRRPQVATGGLGRLPIDVHAGYRTTSLCEGPRGGLAEAACGPGNQRGLSLKGVALHTDLLSQAAGGGRWAPVGRADACRLSPAAPGGA